MPTPPVPRGIPLVGHTLQYQHNPLGFLRRVAQEHGDVVALHIGRNRVFVLNHPDLVQQALAAEQVGKPAELPHAQLERFSGAMLASLERVLSEWRDGQIRDIYDDMTDITAPDTAFDDSIATALAWTWYTLCPQPELEGRLHGEIDVVLKGREPSLDDLPQLGYTLNVVKEVLRLNPPVPALTFTLNKPIELGGYDLREGAEVWVSLSVLHDDSRWWTAPDEFNPMRFNEPVRQGAFMPFAIHGDFALNHIALAVATIAQRFRLTVIDGQTILPGRMNALHMTVHQRTPSERRQHVVEHRIVRE